MSFFSLVAVFLLEQLYPLNYGRWVRQPLYTWMDILEQRINAGRYYHGLLGAVLAVLPPLLVLGVAWGLVHWMGWVFPELFLNVLVLYLTLGFRQFSHFYTDIQLALRLEDEDRARAILAQWRDEPVMPHDAGNIARLSIETALADAYRHVFAVLFWFAVLGPAGALLYRLSHLLAERWRQKGHDEFARFPQQWLAIMDWLPVRVTAIAFAVVGNFVDAMECWRNQSARHDDPGLGIVLASGAGALGVRLGIPLAGTTPQEDSGELGMGDAANADFMQSAIGLVWRAIALWLLVLLVLFVLWLARLAG
jgi:cobalamin biosynthesis protein CobD/CbiB